MYRTEKWLDNDLTFTCKLDSSCPYSVNEAFSAEIIFLAAEVLQQGYSFYIEIFYLLSEREIPALIVISHALM